MAVEHGALLAPPNVTGHAVDGLTCAHPGSALHQHVHLAIYVHGALRPVPAGVGVLRPRSRTTATGPQIFNGACFYNLHTHAQDGVVHVESSEVRTFTLGEFFAIWGQPLSATRVGPYRGAVRVYVNGALRPGDPRTLILGKRAVVQLDVGTEVAPQPVDWSHF